MVGPGLPCLAAGVRFLQKEHLFMQAQDMAFEVAAAEALDAIVAGREGSADARGKLFERCRDYLLLVAERELDPGLQGKMGASDLVQQTFLDAEQGFEAFRGQTEQELIAWLNRILQNRAGQAVRQYRLAAKRNVRSERSLSAWGEWQLAADVETPSRQVAAAEEADRLAAALACLPNHYQTVIQLRNTERKSFDEIGALMGRSPEAARKLWVRAIEQLRVAMTDEGDEG
ncbi:MAG TPA: sigma-70 family RNA polymerase sigma factor [Pirellulales bacterium]|nr:sigma-70 family RNA polymerase sigma factor [Pirellulales bacterium]